MRLEKFTNLVNFSDPCIKTDHEKLLFQVAFSFYKKIGFTFAHMKQALHHPHHS